MSRTNIEIDEELIQRAIDSFGFRSKREAVQLALERLVGWGPIQLEDQLEMEGIGWDGDLDVLRSDRFGHREDDAAG